MNISRRVTGILCGIITLYCAPVAKALYFQAPSPEIVSAWKLNTEDLVVVFRYDGTFYSVDADPAQPGMERGTFEWDNETGAFSVVTIVDTTGDAGFSHPGAATTITVTGNTLNYTVPGDGTYSFTRVVNPASSIVGTWTTPGENFSITFLSDLSYYHAQVESDVPFGYTGMEKGTYTWNSTTKAFTATALIDTNGEGGLDGTQPGVTVNVTGNTLVVTEGLETFTLTRITTNPTPLRMPDFGVERFANYRQASDAAPILRIVGDLSPYSADAIINSDVNATAPTLKIGAAAAFAIPADLDVPGSFDFEQEFPTLSALNTFLPASTAVQFKSGAAVANLTTAASLTFPSIPKIIVRDNASWSGSVYRFGDDAVLQWTLPTGFDASKYLTVVEIYDPVANQDILGAELHGEVTFLDLRGKLEPGKQYEVEIDFYRIDNFTTAGTGVFAGKQGHIASASSTIFEIESLPDTAQQPSIFEQPVSQSGTPGSPLFLTVGINAEAFPTSTFQWYKNGEPLIGQTGNSLYFPSFNPDIDSGTYGVVVTNDKGTAQSNLVSVTQYFAPPSPEIVSAWKLNAGNVVVIFRHDGVFYFIDGEAGHSGMERGTFEWNKTSGVFSADVVVDTNTDAGFSDPVGATTITVSGNTLTYNIAGGGSFPFTRIVNTGSAIVGSWHFPGQDANLTFLADGTYYHSQESDDEPDSTTGMERGTYTWNSGTGAFSASPITDTNGDIGLSDPAPSNILTISGNVMTITEGAETNTARRITPILAPLNTANDFEVDKFANYLQTSASAPFLSPGPPNDDLPFSGEAYIESSVAGTGGTLTITGQSARNFVDDGGWFIESAYTSLATLNAASAFPNGANYVFSRTGGSATLSYPANGAFQPAPAIVEGGNGGTWVNEVYILGLNQTLIWNAHTAYDPSTLVTVLSVVDQETGGEVMYEEVIQGDIVSYDFRGKLKPDARYWVQLEHVKIASSTTTGTGPFAGKLGYALYNSNTRFTMATPAQEVQALVINNHKMFRQVSTAIGAPSGGKFDARVEGVGITNTFPASAITVTKPNNTTLPLAFEGDHWDIETDFPSFADMRAAFPTGLYKINIGSDSIPITLTGSAFPNQPLVTSSVGTWVNGKLQLTASQAAAAFTLTSNSNTAGEGGYSIISITDPADDGIFDNSGILNAEIPAGLLTVGNSYEVEWVFGNQTSLIDLSSKSWASPGASGVERLGMATFLTIEVVPDPVGTPYTTWQSGVFTAEQLADPAISGDDADFDKDGIDTILEFILGGSPTSPNPNLLKNATTTPATVGRNIVFFYDRKTAANGITQVIETSPTLTGTWTPAVNGVAGVVISTAPLDANTERVTVTIPSTEPRLFVRLKASR